MSMQSPTPVSDRVSVIIPVFNRAIELQRAVASALAQTWADVEIVIVDDGSTDRTAQAAEELAQAHPGRIKVVRQANAGPGAARNAGLAEASGEFIQYLDSDDELLPNKFEWQVAALRSQPEAGVAYGLTQRRDERSGELRVWARTGDEIERIFPDFLMQRGWDTNCPLWRRSACDEIGAWAELRCMEDWEHDLRAGLLGIRPVRVRGHVATVNDHGGLRASGMTSGFTRDFTRDFFRAHRSICHRLLAGPYRADPALGEFPRKVFWIARLCAERGLQEEAIEALDLAEALAGPGRSRDVRAFRRMAGMVGWQRAAGWSERLRGMARRLGGGRQ